MAVQFQQIAATTERLVPNDIDGFIDANTLDIMRNLSLSSHRVDENLLLLVVCCCYSILHH